MKLHCDLLSLEIKLLKRSAELRLLERRLTEIRTQLTSLPEECDQADES